MFDVLLPWGTISLIQASKTRIIDQSFFAFPDLLLGQPRAADGRILFSSLRVPKFSSSTEDTGFQFRRNLVGVAVNYLLSMAAKSTFNIGEPIFARASCWPVFRLTHQKVLSSMAC